MAISLGRLRLNPPDPLLLRIGCSDHSHVGSRPLFLERAAALAGRSEVRDANGESGSTLSSVLDGVPFLFRSGTVPRTGTYLEDRWSGPAPVLKSVVD